MLWYIVVLSCKITVNANQVTTRFLDIYMTRKEINTGECCNIDVCDSVVQLCANISKIMSKELTSRQVLLTAVCHQISRAL